MKLLLRPNLEKANGIQCTNRVVEILSGLGAEPMLDNLFQDYVKAQKSCVFGEFEELVDQCDLMIAIGGDGTLLHTAKYAVSADKPLIGINTGRVGYLTQLEGSELEHLSLLVEGRYAIQERMMLEMEMDTPEGRVRSRALNDLVFAQNAHRVIRISVFVGDVLVVEYRADGLIFATPTGSTGYSLSAGGSVVDPAVPAILMTAVCPFLSYNRSLILSSDPTYTVRMEESQGTGQIEIMADGEYVAEIMAGQSVQLRRSEVGVKFVDLGLRDYYQNLRQKLLYRR